MRIDQYMALFHTLINYIHTVFNIPMKENTHKNAFQQANIMVNSKGFSTICIHFDPIIMKSRYDTTIPTASGQLFAAKSVKYSLLKLFSRGVEIKVGMYFNACDRWLVSADISNYTAPFINFSKILIRIIKAHIISHFTATYHIDMRLFSRFLNQGN